MTTHSSALESTIASDEALALPEHAATVQLARALAKELDAATSALPTRTLASYGSVLSQLRRVIRDARVARAKLPPRTATRLQNMKTGVQGDQS